MEVLKYFFKFELKLKTKYKWKKFYLKLNKTLYGLKQVMYEWFKKTDKYLKLIGFIALDITPNLYIRESIFLLLYIDDILFIGNHTDVNTAKKQIISKWRSKDLGPTKLFMGFQIKRNRIIKSLKIY